MKAIIVDLELTQNPGYKPAIIQIGAVLVNTKAHQILDTFNMISNPGQIPNDFIVNLTGITVDQVEKAKPLKDVLYWFWKWIEDSSCGGTLYDWGSGDVWALREASRDHAVEIPRLHTLDLKEMSKLFRQAKDAKSKGGLSNTLELFDMKFHGRPHDALDDAFNTALLLFRFEEMINFACSVERTHGSPRIRNLTDAIKQFENLKDKK
jgi:inhibitor of KinA sporulation pathway (predicted exonuclease)